MGKKTSHIRSGLNVVERKRVDIQRMGENMDQGAEGIGRLIIELPGRNWFNRMKIQPSLWLTGFLKSMNQILFQDDVLIQPQSPTSRGHFAAPTMISGSQNSLLLSIFNSKKQKSCLTSFSHVREGKAWVNGTFQRDAKRQSSTQATLLYNST